jgi:hypothetical protein
MSYFTNLIIISSFTAFHTLLISVYSPEKKITLTMELKDPGKKQQSWDIKVVIKNNTDTLASFYQDWNMWGSDAIRFEMTFPNKTDTLFFTGDWLNKNFPSSEMLFPGDSMVFTYKMIKCQQNWASNCFYNLQEKNIRGAKIRAIYQLNSKRHDKDLAERPKNVDIGLFIIMWSRHNDEFEKLTTQQKLNSFVRDRLVSETHEINFDKW